MPIDEDLSMMCVEGRMEGYYFLAGRWMECGGLGGHHRHVIVIVSHRHHLFFSVCVIVFEFGNRHLVGTSQ